MNTVYLVRHGENVANITKEFSYKLVDYSLTAKGIIQAEQTAEYFIDKGITDIYCSPLKRAIETAEIIAKKLKLNFAIVENFREINVGAFEGNSYSKKDWDIHNAILDDWFAGKHDTMFPEGEDYHILSKRMIDGILKVIDNRSDRNIVVVGHGGIFTTTIKDLCRDIDLVSMRKVQNHNCSISEIRVDIIKGIIEGTLKEWASNSHLHGEAAVFVQGVPKDED
jgi:broad specificity phosphatase PhoE